jgi:hypothetical protein
MAEVVARPEAVGAQHAGSPVDVAAVLLRESRVQAGDALRVDVVVGHDVLHATQAPRALEEQTPPAVEDVAVRI